jgi:Fe-S cluster assembly protein SufD
MLRAHKKEAPSLDLPKEIKEILKEGIENYIVVKDGYIVEEKLTNVFDDVTITDIFEIDQEFHKYYNSESVNSIDSDAFDYNFEEANSGLLIRVKRNKAIPDMLHVFYIQEQGEWNNNTMIILEENSELKYFEYIINYGEASVNFVSNVFALENSNLKYSGISKLNEKAVSAVTRNAFVKRYATVEYSVAEINDSTMDSNTNILLQEEYASGTTKTVAITSKEQEAKFVQLVEHLAKDTEGYIENYGVANNNSTLVFEGIGKIHKDMKRSKAKQQNRGIVLGENSRLDANPLLLIDEFDVEAGHGAAIGKIDEEQLYYLMSRGITLKNAERLIISGFLSPVLENLSNDLLKENFILTVEEKTL